MSETGRVLDAIDGALADYNVSPDAMRWTPERAVPRKTGLMIQGGSPFALQLSERLDDPEVRARFMTAFNESFAEFSRSMQEKFRLMGEAFAEATRAVQPLYESLREAGVLPEVAPEDPRARALWMRQHRNTGPSRDVVHQHRPRRIP